MTNRFLSPLGATLASLLLTGALLSAPAHAVKLMDLRAEGLMMGADSIRKALALTPNQQTVWQQMTAKAWGILRTRQSRRERLQAELKTRLGAGVPDLRDLTGLVDAEDTVSSAEDRQLRELWLTVNDALNDQQRGQVIGLLQSQLDRLDADPERARGAAPGGREEGGRGARQRPGGMGGGGMGGGASGGASGGINIGGGSGF
jgi:hypothetical protein